MEAFLAAGVASIACDRCGQVIALERVDDTVCKHRCPCGKYTGTLRGL